MGAVNHGGGIAAFDGEAAACAQGERAAGRLSPQHIHPAVQDGDKRKVLVHQSARKLLPGRRRRVGPGQCSEQG